MKISPTCKLPVYTCIPIENIDALVPSLSIVSMGFVDALGEKIMESEESVS